MGNASFGNARPELEPGDYLAAVMGVELGVQDDFKNPEIKKPCFIFDIALQMPGGAWENRRLYTSRTITDMNSNPPPKPQFVSGLNKLIRACQQPLPQTEEAVAAWSEKSLVGSRFVWRVETDPETGAKVRKLLALAAQPTAPAPAPAPAPSQPAPVPPPAAPAPSAVPSVAAQVAAMAPAVAAVDPFAAE